MIFLRFSYKANQSILDILDLPGMRPNDQNYHNPQNNQPNSKPNNFHKPKVEVMTVGPG